MSLTNPNKVITEERLSEFYQGILPYLGGSADAGFTPVGSIIAIMGVTAPANYLACNGQIVNVVDYPELANYFEQQFGTKYKFGGSGTTFGIPDLRGEFLRGTGTNSHTGQGNGASVGTHQNATEESFVHVDNTGNNVFIGVSNNINNTWTTAYYDSIPKISSPRTVYILNKTTTTDSFSSDTPYTSRPTNTSVLWCIATKDIFLNPSMDYSTSEKVVGKWFDGKPLYQKTVSCGALPNASYTTTAHGIANIDSIVGIIGMAVRTSDHISLTLPYASVVSAQDSVAINASRSNIRIDAGNDKHSFDNSYVTIQYTKTTD